MDGSLARNFRNAEENIAPASTTTGRLAPEALMDGPAWDARMADLASIFRDAQATITADQVSVAPMDTQAPATADQVSVAPMDAQAPATADQVSVAPMDAQAPATADQVLIALDQIMASRMYRERNRSL